MNPHRRHLGDAILSRLELLTEEEERSLKQHLHECPDCRELCEGSEEAAFSEAFDGHLPSVLVARWRTLEKHLQGLERSLVEKHLKQCSSCREELDLVREGTVATVWGEEPAPPAGSSAVIQLAPVGPRERFRWMLAGGVAGFAVAAAAVALVFLPRSGERPPQRVVPWVAPGTIRGTAHSVSVSSGTRDLVLAVPVPAALLESTSPVEVVVSGPKGGVLLRVPLDLGTETPSVMVLLRTKTALVSGSYTVRYRLLGTGEEPAPPVYFRIRLAP